MIELILLGMLFDERPLTSYDLKKYMERSTEFFHNTSLGSIQPALKKMAEQGYLTAKEAVENNRLKKYYTITESGKAYFHTLIRQDLGPDKIRCSQLVKVFFFDKLSKEERLASVKQFLEEVKLTTAVLKQIKVDSDTQLNAMGLTLADCPSEAYQMDTLQFGLDYYQFLEQWFMKYLQKIEIESEATPI